MKRYSVLVTLSVDVLAEDKLAAEILVEEKVRDELTSEYDLQSVAGYWAMELPPKEFDRLAESLNEPPRVIPEMLGLFLGAGDDRDILLRALKECRSATRRWAEAANLPERLAEPVRSP